MTEAPDRFIIGSLNRYRSGALSVSKKPSIHYGVDDAKTELDRLRRIEPSVDFQAFKLPLDFPLQPFEFSL